jgi:hypothetical protein
VSKAAVAITSLLYYNYRPVLRIWRRGIELLLSSNITPSFEDTEYKETCLPDLSGQKWEVYKMPSILISEGAGEGILSLLPNIVFTATLVIFYYALYKCRVKVWRSSRSFHKQPRVQF